MKEVKVHPKTPRRLITVLLLTLVLIFGQAALGQDAFNVGKVDAQKVFMQGGYQQQVEKEFQEKTASLQENEGQNQEEQAQQQQQMQQAYQEAQQEVEQKFWENLEQGVKKIAREENLKAVIQGELLYTEGNMNVKDISDKTIDEVKLEDANR